MSTTGHNNDIEKDGTTDYRQIVIQEGNQAQEGSRTETQARNLTGSESASSSAVEKANIGCQVSFTVKIRNRTPLSGGTTSC